MHSVHRLIEQASNHVAQRRWTDACTSLNLALAQDPRNIETLIALSCVHASLGSYGLGRSYTLEAAHNFAGEPNQILTLARRLRIYNESATLRNCLRRIPPPNKLPILVLLGLAAITSSLNDQNEALTFLDEAVRADPDYPPTLASRSQVLGYFGRFDEAAHDLEHCLTRAPSMAHAHWLLSRIRLQTPGHNHVARLREQLASTTDPGNEAFLAYALQKELHDLGDYASAWVAIQRGAAAKRRLLQYRSEDSRAIVEALITAVHAGRASPQDSDITPIFIVGMHRSGTTLMERLLAGHSATASAGELYDFPAQMRLATDHHCRGTIDLTIVQRATSADFESIGRGYLDAIRWRVGDHTWITDKLPSNFLNLGYIGQALPQARILHMVRDPMDTCVSNLRELFSDACPYSYDQMELADYYHQYRRLMAHWHEVMPGRILDVPYATLISDTATVVRQVAAFCGLPFEARMLEMKRTSDAVATASSPQIREGIHRKGFDAWRHYEQWLIPLRQRLQHYGYV